LFSVEHDDKINDFTLSIDLVNHLFSVFAGHCSPIILDLVDWDSVNLKENIAYFHVGDPCW
jgi:hypothetical protein